MVLCFYSIGVLIQLWVLDLRTLAQFQEREMSTELFQDFINGYMDTIFPKKIFQKTQHLS